MKSDNDLSSEEILAALGHVNDVTKSTYGHANMGRGGGVAPTKVSAVRAVKMKTRSKAAEIGVKPLSKKPNKYSRRLTARRAATLIRSAMQFTLCVNRRLRAYACTENGLRRPIRINGRLAWQVA